MAFPNQREKLAWVLDERKNESVDEREIKTYTQSESSFSAALCEANQQWTFYNRSNTFSSWPDDSDVNNSL